MLMVILEGLYIAGMAFTSFILLYQLVMALLSGRKKETPREAHKLHRFAVVISARNEERVIKNIVHSLKMQNYPKDKYDIFVIADNCTDRTAENAKDAGAFVFKRFAPEKRSKGYALNWFFERILKNENGYDAFAIFDADNHVDPEFLSVMNRHLCAGKKILQGFRDVTNPSESWVTGGYSIYLWYMSRFFQRTRSTLKLSGIVSGTGFVFSKDVIRSGWNTRTVTEDTEFTIQQVLSGNRVEFAEDAIFYDEQPTTFIQSWHQRYRWSYGSLQCCKLYIKPLISKALKNFDFKTVDLLIFTLAAPCAAVFFATTILGAVIQLIKTGSLAFFMLTNIKWLALSIIVMYIGGAIITKSVGKSVKSVWKGLLTFPIFLITWTLISLFACFYRNPKWRAIEHHGRVVPNLYAQSKSNVDIAS